MSEGSLEGIPPYRIPSEHTINIGGMITILRSQKQIECQPSWDWMIMTPCLLLDMAEGH